MTGPAAEPTHDAPQATLSHAESAEFARGLAGIARAGLPLAGGLRALAAEMPRGTLARMLEAVADRVESGDSLDEALEAEGPRFPAPLRGLIAAGARSGRLSEALGRLLELDDLGRSLRRQMIGSMIYPAVLVVTAFALFLFVSMVTTHGFEAIFQDFGIDVPWLTQVLLAASRGFAAAGPWMALTPIVAIAATWIAMRLTLGSAERRALLHRLPMIGPLMRDTALAQFCPVLALMLESEVPLGEALRLSADSARDPVMTRSAREMASEVESGSTLAEAVRDRPPFPRRFDLFLAWAEGRRGLVSALELAAETSEARARSQARYVSKFCNVLMMTVVCWWVTLTVVALLMPLLTLLSKLGGPVPTGFDVPQMLQIVGAGFVLVVALGAVAVLCWPLMGQILTIAASGVPRARARERGRFWHFGLLGLTMFGTAMVALVALAVMNVLLKEWLSDWWFADVWPMTEVLGAAIGLTGLIIVAFAALASRVARGREARTEAGASTGPRTGLKLPAWRFGLRHLMFAMVPIALLVSLVRDVGWSLLSLVALLLPPLVTVAAYVVVADRRSLQREALLQVLAMAARDGRPLGPAVSAFAPGCRGRYRRKVAELAFRLERGQDLPEALDLVPKVLPRPGEVAARVGWQSGTLSKALDDAVASASASRSLKAAVVGSIGYPLVVLAIVVGIGGFLLVSVAPQFRTIFKDFGVPLPEPSRTVFALAEATLGEVVPRDLALGLLIGLGIAALTAAVTTAAALLLRAILGGLAPGGGVSRAHDAAVVLRSLAASVEIGRPVPETLGRVAESYPRRAFRGRLLRALKRIERGEDWCAALASERVVGRAQGQLLEAASRAGNLPWALREAAEAGERRAGYRLAAVAQVVQTVLIGAVGVLVLLLAVTYLRPLVAMIDHLSRTIQ